MRLNPNPRLEKLKDFRSAHYLYCFYFTANPHTRQWANNRRERSLRRDWRDHRWEARDCPTRFSHRHTALWDLY